MMRGREQCLVGSLTGAVASQRVSEAFKGWLISDGNRDESVYAKASLTVRPTSQAGAKAGVNDPLISQRTENRNRGQIDPSSDICLPSSGYDSGIASENG